MKKIIFLEIFLAKKGYFKAAILQNNFVKLLW